MSSGGSNTKSWGVLLPLVLLMPLLPSVAASEAGHPTSDRTAVVARPVAVVQPAAEAVAEPDAPAIPASPEPYPHGRTLSPLTPRVVAHLRQVSAAHPDLDDRVFAKVGDSMTVARAYLRCFGTEETDLGVHADLADSLDWFRRGRIGRHDPFRRVSEAARVGWSSNHVLGGRRSPLARELARTRARFATVMLGTNEIDSDAPRRFVRRMWRIVDVMLERGVIPIMNTIPGRMDSRHVDARVPLYNQLVRGIAQARAVPLVDIARELDRLDRRGLARDGVHPNVYVRRGRGRPCELTDDGLAFGHNVRNLRVLQMLDRLRHSVVEGEGAPDAGAPPPEGMGTPESPIVLPKAPFTVMRPWPDGVDARHHQLTLQTPSSVSLAAFARDGERFVIEVRGDDGELVASARSELELRLGVGRWRLAVRDDRGDRGADEYLLVALPRTQANPY